MKTFTWAAFLAALSACAMHDDARDTAHDGRVDGAVAGEVGHLTVVAPERMWRDAKETRIYEEPRYTVYDEQGRVVFASRTWHGEETARVPLTPGRYRVKLAEPLEDDRDEIWVTVNKGERTVVDLDDVAEQRPTVD